MPKEWTRRVNGLLQTRGIGPGQLASYTNLSRGTVYLWQRHPERPVEPESVQKVADYAGWPLDAALEWAGIGGGQQRDALSDLQSVLFNGPWPEPVRDALWQLGQATVPRSEHAVQPSDSTAIAALVEASLEVGPWPKEVADLLRQFLRVYRGVPSQTSRPGVQGGGRRGRRHGGSGASTVAGGTPSSVADNAGNG